MTTTEINKEAKKQARKFCKGQNIVSINIKKDVVYCNLTDFGSDNIFTWKFIIVVNEGNEDCFSEYEKIKFPELIEKTTIKIEEF